MDQSQSDNELSMSPSKILERLQLLRQLQLLQRGKLQKHRLDYQETIQSTTGSTEIVSQFSNSTGYNTFHSSPYSLAEIANGNSADSKHVSDISKLNDKDLIDGVSVLNLSQESEFIAYSLSSNRSKGSSINKAGGSPRPQVEISNSSIESTTNPTVRKHIELDEMPILSPRKDFETMLLEKLKNDKKAFNPDISKVNKNASERNKKPFLRRGEGMARFGLRKKDLVIENTKSLPWRRKSTDNKSGPSTKTENVVPKSVNNNNEKVDILVPPSVKLNIEKPKQKLDNNKDKTKDTTENSSETVDSSNCEIHGKNKQEKSPIIKKPDGIYSLKVNRGKTWASVFTKEQDDFLRQLKQSDYYKNFTSPTKSTLSDISCNESFAKVSHEREKAEQNMFELLENKVARESFSFESSFFSRFVKKSQLDCSGESTPLVFQKCLANNPNLLHILPEIIQKNKDTNSDVQSCDSECGCDHETCSSVSTCSTCKTLEDMSNSPCITKPKNDITQNQRTKKVSRKETKQKVEKENCHDNTVTETDIMKADMAEMNAKLMATSELLKDRLKELEDEIETFRTENANLSKLKEQVDLERQKFYEEKATFEQKFHEEKILTEYYLAEEKEKLSKQKLIYEKYVREMRGRLNKKDKDEVTKLKQEVCDLKEEIRMKDAKSTTIIARLRNQLKIMEREKKTLQDEVSKLEKENRRIHHSNEMTRRLSNIKYLEQINKKLSNMAPKEIRSEINLDKDIKYKAYEIERQCRGRIKDSVTNSRLRPRAKSVPNLKVTSRYAKYFSQRDVVSEMQKNRTCDVEANHYDSEEVYINGKYNDNNVLDLNDSVSTLDEESHDVDMENNLEKMYIERFKSSSPISSKSSLNHSESSFIDGIETQIRDRSNTFFLRKSTSSRDSKSPKQCSTSPHFRSSTESSRSRSPVSVVSQRPLKSKDDPSNKNTRPKSPISILSNRSSGSKKTDANEKSYAEMNQCSETTSRTSFSKTALNPIEIKKPDGSRELKFPNGNVKFISSDGKYTKFVYYNGDVKENFYDEGRIKYYYAETKTSHTTHPDGLEVLEFPDGQVEKRYKDGSTEIRLPNGSVRYHDPKNQHVREEWRFPDGTTMTVSAAGEQRVVFSNGQVEVHAKDHKRREFPDGTVKLMYNDGTTETRYSSGRVRIKDKHGNLIMDSAPG